MASITFTDSEGVAGTGTPAGTYTFANQAVGAANAARHVVCGAVWRSGQAFVSATIGGVSATSLATFENPSDGTGMAWFYAAVPTGTTATVVVVVGGASNRMGLVVYTSNDDMNWAGVQTGTDAVNGSGLASPQVIDPDANTTTSGFAIGLAAFASAGASLAWAWTGLTEDVDTAVETLEFSGASLSNTSAQTPLSITATATVTGTINDPTALVVSIPVTAAGGLSIPVARNYYRMMQAR